jgi:hypothetical protein
MTSPRQLPTDARNLDGFLRAFFRAEMPDPWPAFQPPAAQAEEPRRRSRRERSLFRSRLALAAAILFFLIGPLYLAGTFTEPPAREPVDQPTGVATNPVPGAPKGTKLIAPRPARPGKSRAVQPAL